MTRWKDVSRCVSVVMWVHLHFIADGSQPNGGSEQILIERKLRGWP